MARKTRIEIKIVTKGGSSELSIVEGRLMANGEPAPGPTDKQIAIAQCALLQLCGVEIPDAIRDAVNAPDVAISPSAVRSALRKPVVGGGEDA